MPNISRGNVAVQWFSTRHERVKPKAAPAVPTRKVKEGCAVNYWTPREDEVIKAFYVTKGPEALGERFGRPAKSVTARANELGLRMVWA